MDGAHPSGYRGLRWGGRATETRSVGLRQEVPPATLPTTLNVRGGLNERKLRTSPRSQRGMDVRSQGLPLPRKYMMTSQSPLPLKRKFNRVACFLLFSLAPLVVSCAAGNATLQESPSATATSYSQEKSTIMKAAGRCASATNYPRRFLTAGDSIQQLTVCATLSDPVGTIATSDAEVEQIEAALRRPSAGASLVGVTCSLPPDWGLVFLGTMTDGHTVNIAPPLQNGPCPVEIGEIRTLELTLKDRPAGPG